MIPGSRRETLRGIQKRDGRREFEKRNRAPSPRANLADAVDSARIGISYFSAILTSCRDYVNVYAPMRRLLFDSRVPSNSEASWTREFRLPLDLGILIPFDKFVFLSHSPSRSVSLSSSFAVIRIKIYPSWYNIDSCVDRRLDYVMS